MNSLFFKKLKLEREKPYDYSLIIQTRKNTRRKIAGRCFLKPFFSHSRKRFSRVFVQNFLSLLNMISLAYKIFHCLSANHYLEVRCIICNGVTLFALLSANQNRVIFSCVLVYSCFFLYLNFLRKTVAYNSLRYFLLILHSAKKE